MFRKSRDSPPFNVIVQYVLSGLDRPVSIFLHSLSGLDCSVSIFLHSLFSLDCSGLTVL